jgi:hypothetical protein
MNIDNQYLDQQRWLMNNGLFTDSSKDTLFMYGSLVNKFITAVEVSIDSDNKHVSYTLYAASSLIRAYNKYHELKGSASLWDMWQIKRLLKKHGNLELRDILNSFVMTYCGPGWGTDLTVKKNSEYEEQGPKTTDDTGKDR